MFDFDGCVAWLRVWADQVGERGAHVELMQTLGTVRSILLRLSAKSIEAELVVWDNGKTSAMVYDLKGDCFVVDRHEVVLTRSFEAELRPFLVAVDGRI